MDVTSLLEDLIDKHGLQHILLGLELVCGEKADHIGLNWQDRSLAKAWNTASLKCGKLAREITL